MKVMNPFLLGLYKDLEMLERKLSEAGASHSMQSRARDARNAINWLQEEMDKK